MKRFKQIVFFFIAVIFMFGCGGNLSSSSISVENGLSNNGMTDIKNGDVTLSEAINMAQVFVRANMPGDIVFNNSGLKGCEAVSAVENRFKILQEFTLTDETGKKGKYIYKTYVQYFGGDKTSVTSWEYGVLTIESRETGKQSVFRGEMKSREKYENSTGSYKANNIIFDVIDSRPKKAIKLSFKENLSRQQVVKAFEELHSQLSYEKYILCKYPDKDNSMYECWLRDNSVWGVYDYSQSKSKAYVYDNLEDFLNKRNGVDLEKD